MTAADHRDAAEDQEGDDENPVPWLEPDHPSGIGVPGSEH
jgi:hypothetical protein